MIENQNSDDIAPVSIYLQNSVNILGTAQNSGLVSIQVLL